MCTVSYIPVKDKVLITSNRDEKKVRSIAFAPAAHTTPCGQVFYPTDGDSSGTWFITNNKGDAGVLLNGATRKHIPKGSYKASRGSILPAIFAELNVMEGLRKFDFEGIENCTIVLYSGKQLFECRWDGILLEIKRMDEATEHIWSSVTLYDDSMIAERKEWFRQHIEVHSFNRQQDAIDFHSNTYKGNKEYGLQINRDNIYLTVSITSIEISKSHSLLYYFDFLQNTESVIDIELQTSEPSLINTIHS